MIDIQIPLKEIGRIRPRSANEIAGSFFTLGCEVLDRDFANYDEYKEYIVPLGIKTIRLQAGWAKTEKVPGKYDFAWLDHIIDDAVGRGLNILLETDYGNPAYPGGGGPDLAGGFPESEEALAAWDRWVEAMARRYAGKVRDWAMWNEPDIDSKKTVPMIVDFNIRTMKIIRRIIPDARIAGLSLASELDKFNDYLVLLKEKNELDSFDWIIYHGYQANPDRAYETGVRLKNFLARYTSKVKLRQGENGCPSERTIRFALWGYDWTELSQAKWDLRRFIGDIGTGVETSVFTICDFNHLGRQINRKGLLRAEEDHKVVRKKLAYYAIQHMTSVFDNTLQPVSSDRVSVFFNRCCALFPFTETQGRGNILAYWNRSDIPGDAVAAENAEILFKDFPFDEPVLADLITGKVYEIPSDRISKSGEYVVFRNIPVLDSPFLIAEKRLLHMVGKNRKQHKDVDMNRFSLNASLKIILSAEVPEPLHLAAQDLARDIRSAADHIRPEIVSCPAASDCIRIAIVPEQFPAGSFEAYHVYSQPDNVLRIDGSDLRGAIYGIYEFSRRYLGIQPDYLWNMLPVRKLTSAEWSGIDFSAGNPQIRYRGIFINDEDLLTAWETGEKREIDYPFYHTVISRAVAERIAETVIRMGYNLAIPASFLDIRNPAEEMLAEVFSRRGLILSMHHVEPLGVSAFGFENYWKKRGQKRDYSYFRDPEALLEVWTDSINRWKKYPEVIWQLGLRGRGDSPFWTEDDALKTDSERAALIGNAIRRQYELVRSLTGDPEPVCTTTLWGEGSVFNRQGILPVPKEVIKVFSDNCAGWRIQDDFHESPVIPGERSGLYCHHAVVVGTHLAQAIGPADFYAVLKNASTVRPLDYVIFNVSNVREFVLGMTATAEMTHDLETFSPQNFLSGWVREHFSARHAEIEQCYKAYFAAFEKNARGVAYYNDGLLNTEIQSAVLQYRGTQHLDRTFLASLRDMFPYPSDPDEKIAVMERMEHAMTEVGNQARAIRASLPEEEKKFLYAQLQYPAELYRHFCAAAAASIRAESALSANDRGQAAEFFRSALTVLKDTGNLLPEYLSHPFEHWYDDCRKVDFRNTARLLEEWLNKN